MNMSGSIAVRCTCLVLAGALTCHVGCHANREELALTANDVVSEIDRLSETVSPMPPDATDAAMHALNSGDPKIRAEAAISLSKSKRLTQSVSRQLANLAVSDADPVVRAAAISALFEHGPPSREIMELTKQLCDDPQLSLLASRLSRER